jgi:hypothetical protein
MKELFLCGGMDVQHWPIGVARRRRLLSGRQKKKRQRGRDSFFFYWKQKLPDWVVIS